MDKSIFDESPLSARDFVGWLKSVSDGLVFDARRPQGCLLALFFKAKLGDRFFTAQFTYAVIDRKERQYGATWAARVADCESRLANDHRDPRRAAPSADDKVELRVGDIRDRLLALLSEFG